MRVTRPVAFMVTLLLGAAACGGDSGSESTTAPTSTTTRPSETISTPTTESDSEGFVAESVVAGDQHACALDDGGRAWCWGYNRFGQLGTGDTTDSNRPRAVSGGVTFDALAAGRYFTCGLTSGADAYCWGDNSRGQLGNGESGAGSGDADRSAPVPVSTDLSFSALVTGQLHACGLTADGEAWCWGAYASGQLGNGVGSDQSTPVRSAEGLAFASLAPGGDTHTCGVTAAGEAWCWGNNTFGQLGDGEKTNARQPEPRRVTGGSEFTALVLGRTHTCGLDREGQVWCWGANDMGQLGDGTTEERLDPTRVSSEERFASLTAGDSHTCAVTDGGDTFCWGDNGMGQLGVGDEPARSASPVAVTGGLRFRSASAGEEFTCAVATDGTAWCWGSNRVGWLGRGSDEPSATPVPVAAPSGA